MDCSQMKFKLVSGRLMPIIGFGTYLIQGDQLIHKVLDAALAAGYRQIDTATVYHNESSIGLALKSLLPKYNLKREDIFITSKLSPSDQGEKAFLAVQDSLRKLDCGYLDLYLIHWPGAGRLPVESKENYNLRSQSWQALTKAVHAGYVKDIGVSNYTVKHLTELLANDYGVKPAVNQVEWHPKYYQPELLDLCRKEGILLQAYSSLGGTGNSDLLDDPTVNKIAKQLGVTQAQRSANFGESATKKLRVEDDIHRTGAKCLENDIIQDPRKEGAAYHVTGVVRTKPGRGDPTLSVSCSDKLAKWCHLGIQGGLLSILLTKPVYLSSLIIASSVPFWEASLQRALYGRCEGVELLLPYKKTLLKFHQARGCNFKFQKNAGKEVCPSSICWFKCDGLKKPVEVSVDGKKQGVTKKNKNLPSSRLKICKAEMFNKFQKLNIMLNNNCSGLNYVQCKRKAELYQNNWKILKRALGTWPEKDKTLLEFVSE